MLIGAPLAPSLDHLGVLARTVDDIGLLLGGLAAPVPEAAESGLRVGWLGGWFEAVLGEDVRATMRRTRAVLEDGGFRIDDVIVADEPLMPAAVLARIQTEAGAFHRTAFEADPSGFGEDIATLMRMPATSADQLAACEEAIRRFATAVNEALVTHDVLVSATVPITAPRIGAATVGVDGDDWPVEFVLTRHTSIFNAIGLPAAAVPVALADGLPVGLQVVGSASCDDRVLHAARLVEQLVPRLPGPSRFGGLTEGPDSFGTQDQAPAADHVCGT